jgi:signal peptidase I
MILWSLAFLSTRSALAMLFKKAGISWYLAFIPILSWWYWIKLVDRPKWYMIGMVIPCVNILFSFNITLDLLRSFGQFKFWQHFFGIVFTFIYLPIIAFRKEVVFKGPAGNAEWRKKNVPTNVGSREWADALLFAAYVAGGMRALYFDLYQIPTPSMESNLMVGDFLVVSRAKVGMRIPMTPITIPVIAHKDLMGFKAFSDIVELPYMRLPGWYTIKNNDVIVFNWPADNNEEFPVDKRDNYVKRCIGVPGDSILIQDANIYINGKLLPRVGHQQKRYEINMKNTLTTEFLAKYDLGVAEPMLMKDKNNEVNVVNNSYIINTWDGNAAALKKDPEVAHILLDPSAKYIGGHGAFLDSSFIHGKWQVSDLDNYGPFYLPKRGDKITLNFKNWKFYARAINGYEGSTITTDGIKFYLDGKEVTSYTFKYGYYWMMGDNRYNSYDSRMWGYVPEDHVVGKPLFTFLSMKKAQTVIEGRPQKTDADPQEYIYEFQGFRYDKILKKIE